MNKQTVHTKLSEAVSGETRSELSVADAFIKELFNEVEKELIANSFIKIEGLGLLRVIKSGENKRILYLGSNTRLEGEIDLTVVNKHTHTTEAIGDNISFDSDSYNDKGADELFESFEERYPQHNQSKNLPQGEPRKNVQNSEYTYIANRKMNLIKTCIIALAILLLASVGYILISGASSKPDEKSLRDIGFRDIENTDTLAFNKMVVPQVDVSLQYIARIYYGDEIYWPYVFIANKDAANKNLVVRGGTVIRIPRISVDLADLHDGKLKTSLKSLATDIIKVERND
ncbi:hypothetical protein [Dysgonomonas macrotermitis]|uniref:LysM domain-containing protein n=1 Tax=Dysgonomonas macrotermitis TaxID=1346286 RepID=A0A1M4ZJJ9_9BACT|nr:hypothetical protein [Dysgonomonas macrotermitis]SHF17726.1 hypothetical protein SAMN05444362_10496 [Dysgonomonas macrotermitis]